MKKICSILLVAAAASALFSCQKPEVTAPVINEEVVLTFASEKPAFDDETKTEWTGETIQWSVGDKISVAYTVDGNWQNATGNASGDAKLYKSDALTKASEVAQFNVSASFEGTTEGTHVFYGVYPAPSSTSFSNAPVATLTVASVQNTKTDTYDSVGDLMLGVSKEYNSRPSADETISLKWERLVAHAVITLKDINGYTSGENLEYITLTAQSDANLVGQQQINLIEGTVVKDNNAANVLKLAADKLTVTNGNVTFWACFLPETITSLTVEVETDKATYTREITGISKEFKKNARNTLSVKMNEAIRVVKPVDNNVIDVLNREITGMSGSTYDSWSGKKCTSDAVYAGQSAGGNESIQLRSNNNNSGVITTASGGYARKIVVQWNSNTSSGRTLNVYGNTTAYTTPADLYASETQGTLLGTIVCGTSTDLTIEGDYEYIGMRSASGAMYLEEIKISWAPNTTPSIKLAETTEVSAEGCEGTIEVKYANIDDVVALLKFYADDTYSEIASYNWLTAEIDEDNNVHYLVEANESSEPRTAYLAVFVGDVYEYFTITQEGYVDYSVIQEVTVAEFLAKSVDTRIKYQLTGVMTGTYNTDYGNFYLQDETGQVLVYGLTATEQTSNDKSFATLGLRDGDTLTLIGTRADYNGTAQVGGPAYYVSHVAAPYIEVAATTITVEADDTTLDIDVMSNTSWTVTASNGVTVDTESGEGDAGITVDFEENTTSSPVSYVITISAEGCEDVVVTINQKGVSNGDGDDLGTPSSTPCYTLSTETIQGTNNSYASNCDIDVNGIKWNVTGNTKINPWRIGGKSLTNTDRTVYSKTAYSSALSKVEFVSGQITATWNSMKLEYSTDASFNDAQTLEASVVGANKTISFTPEGGFPANCYFRFTLNISVTGDSNKYVQLNNIIFYGYEN